MAAIHERIEQIADMAEQMAKDSAKLAKQLDWIIGDLVKRLEAAEAKLKKNEVMLSDLFIQIMQLQASTPTVVPVSLDIAHSKVVDLSPDTTGNLTLLQNDLESEVILSGTTVKLSGLERDTYPAVVCVEGDATGGGRRQFELRVTQASAGTNRFDWSTGDISKATWDAFLATLPVNGTTSRPQPSTYNYAIGVDVPEGRLLPATDFEVPTIGVDEKILAFAEPTQHNPHCMLMLSNSTGFHGSHNGYVPAGVPFEITIELDMVDPIAEYQAKPWAIVWQLHPGTFPPGWAVSKNPPLGLYLINGSWRFEHRGSTNATPTSYDHDTWSAEVPTVSGQHQIVVRWYQDYTGTNSYVQCLVDGDEIYESTLTNGINYSALGAGVEGCLCPFGNYRSDLAGSFPDFKYSSVQLWRN